MGDKMRLKGFTLIEILISVLVIAILSSVSIVTWDKMVDRVRQDICGQNQSLQAESLKLYIYDKRAVPASLSQLEPCYVDMAIAKLKKERPFIYAKRKISLAMLNIDIAKDAWAVDYRDYIGNNSSILKCPADTRAVTYSYGYNSQLLNGNPIDAYNNIVSGDEPIICDCNGNTFDGAGGNLSGAAFRHGSRGVRNSTGGVAIAAGANGQAVAVYKNNASFWEGWDLRTKAPNEYTPGGCQP